MVNQSSLVGRLTPNLVLLLLVPIRIAHYNIRYSEIVVERIGLDSKLRPAIYDFMDILLLAQLSIQYMMPFEKVGESLNDRQ